ncbi:hypothetical protein Ctob_006447 [Chrysochromulina tobinii]|uniref:Uncharacterized protein n=1 Tax=Chrysochromulina tobinii TaxID=1460289 RepID=A0A0M0JZ07_9EUKA|nr:hypothetical protein Ctob_006447 [Chrysochromulina tobinii]|eukprot:KOO31804.1 hypothetical protein Ctob_006447 [Chrysochromulina sp. CCMP291]
MSCSTSRSVISPSCVGTGCPSRRHRRVQRTRRASARQNPPRPLSSTNVATSTRPRAASVASAENEGCCSGAGGAVELAGCCGASKFSGANAGSAIDTAAPAIRRPMSTGLVPSVMRPSVRSTKRSSSTRIRL